ncbi:MAG: zinc ribbon domain-containing protein [Planctomycetota bacterium]|nr:zinc ribbon domain-containing protein [Planctomycetota bacterium]
MSVVVDLPNCVQCGAAPTKRGEPACAYCGAVLPWELWDELSKRRVEVTPVQETALDQALQRAQRSASGPISRARSRIQRMRRRRRRANAVAAETYRDRRRVEGLVGFCAFGVFALASWVIEQPVAGTIGVVVIGGVVWSLVKTNGRRSGATRVGRRRGLRRHGEARVAASVLAVSQPELTPGTETHWRRVVTLHVGRGHQRVLLASADVGVRAGDTGIANVLGNELVGFRVHENVLESVGAASAAG